MSHFSIFIHEYIIFQLHSVSFTLSLYSPFSHCYHLPAGPVFTFLFFLFKKGIFVCSNSSTGSFSYDFSRYICIITQVGRVFHFFPFYLSPLFMVISTGLKILYSFLYRKYITHIHLFNFILLPSLSC
jgi:hypothetical protein